MKRDIALSVLCLAAISIGGAATAEDGPVPVGGFSAHLEATVLDGCEILSTSGDWVMDFGDYFTLSDSHADAEFSFSVLCTEGVRYSVRLPRGDRFNLASNRRQMFHVNVYDQAMAGDLTNEVVAAWHTLLYDTYSDPSYSEAHLWRWDEHPGIFEADGDVEQDFTIYGRIHAGQATTVGMHRDIIPMYVRYE